MRHVFHRTERRASEICASARVQLIHARSTLPHSHVVVVVARADPIKMHNLITRRLGRAMELCSVDAIRRNGQSAVRRRWRAHTNQHPITRAEAIPLAVWATGTVACDDIRALRTELRNDKVVGLIRGVVRHTPYMCIYIFKCDPLPTPRCSAYNNTPAIHIYALCHNLIVKVSRPAFRVASCEATPWKVCSTL